jgi:uncharacterized membrane protein YbhN (UPF0104 family)
MHDLLGAFVAGALLGAATLVVFRREINLTHQATTVAVLAGVGCILAAGMWAWSRSLLRRTEQETGARKRPPLPRAWARFIGAGLALLVLYVALAATLLLA